MNREDLIKQLRRDAKANGVEFEKYKARGKGSHLIVKYGDKKTTVPKGELKTGTLKAILKQLGLK